MSRVVILAEAADDIEAAREFYDSQQPGIWDYCANSLVADIESLALYHGIHDNSAFTGCWQVVFPLASTIARQKTRRRSVPFWIYAENPDGFGRNWDGAAHEASRKNHDFVAPRVQFEMSRKKYLALVVAFNYNFNRRL